MVYPINEMIEKLLSSAVDEETGEVKLTDEELQGKLEQLQMDFDDKIIALRNSYKTDKLEAECIAAEAKALWKLQQETSGRAKAKENRAERTKRFIAWLLQGETFEKDGCKVSYKTTTNNVVEDGFVDWARQHAPGFLNEPTVRKEDLNRAIKAGNVFEFVHQEETKSIVVR